MGGVAGHLSHLYDNRSLTFNQIKKVLSLASMGDLIGTEKTDGFNIFLGFKDGVPRAARNKGDMKKGGMTPEELAAREFAGGASVKKVYNDAFRAFKKAVLSLSKREQEATFGSAGESFYNAEIQGPGASNVVNYDANVISIHAGGHRSYDAATNSVVVVDAEQGSKTLDKIINKFEQATADEDFSVRKTAFLKLKQLDNDYDLKIALAKMNKAGFDGSMTVENFLEQSIQKEVNQKFSYLSDIARQDIIDKVLAKPEAKNLVQIYKGFPAEEKQKLRAFIKNGPALIGKTIWPIEEAIHDFAVELLRGLNSAYILDNEAEVKRLKAEVAQAIKNIRAYSGPGQEEAHKVLAQQLRKIKHLDNINTTVEGFVFQYGDQLYKFTGNFAPVNQLLGLFRYGRGTVPPIKQDELQEQGGDEISEETVRRKVAVIPGKFKPPHRGHLDMVEHYAQVADVVVILISPISVTTQDGLEINREESKQIWQLYLNSSDVVNTDRVVIARSPFNSPVQSAYELVAGGVNEFKPRPGDLIIPGASTKPDPQSGCADTERFARFHNIPKEKRLPGVMTANVEDYAFMPQGEDVGCVLSARNLRTAIDKLDYTSIQKYIPDNVNAENVLDIVFDGDVPTQSLEKKTEQPSLSSLDEVTLQEKWNAYRQDCVDSEGKKGKAVVKKSETGAVESCHMSLDKAKSAVRARYTNYNEEIDQEKLEESMSNLLKKVLSGVNKVGDALRWLIDIPTEEAKLKYHEKLSKENDWYPDYFHPIKQRQEIVDTLEILYDFVRRGSFPTPHRIKGRWVYDRELDLDDYDDRLLDLWFKNKVKARSIIPYESVPSSIQKTIDIETGKTKLPGWEDPAVRMAALVEDDDINEISTMAGGAVSGYSGPVKKRKRKNKQLFSEDEAEQIVKELYNIITKGVN